MKRFLSVIIIVITIISCTREDRVSYNIAGSKQLTSEAARVILEQKVKALKLTRFSKLAKTKSSLTDYLTIDWKNSTATESSSCFIIQVPIKTQLKIQVSSYAGIGHFHYNIHKTNIASYIVVQKHKQADYTRIFVMTDVGLADLNGYKYFSTADGKYLAAYKYNNGKRKPVRMEGGGFRTDSSGNDIKYCGFSIMVPSKVLSKGGDGGLTSGEDNNCICGGVFIDGYCNLCGMGLLDEIIVSEEPCPFCGYYVCRCCESCGAYPCICLEHNDYCPICNNDPCICDLFRCPYCHELFCNGECQSNNGGDSDDGNEPENKSDSTLFTLALSINNDNWGSVTGDGVYPANTNVSISAMPAYGYSFGGWSSDGILEAITAAYHFNITSDRCLRANFNVRNSPCDLIFRNYIANIRLDSLSSFIRNLYSSVEHCELVTENDFIFYREGEEKGISFNASDYNFRFIEITHTHTEGEIPIISPGDFIALWKLCKYNKFVEGGKFVVTTDEADMSVEICDLDSFVSFGNSYFSKENFEDLTYNSINLLSGNNASMHDINYINNAMLYYLQTIPGINIFFKINIAEDHWRKVELSTINGRDTISFSNCITI